MDKLRNSDFLKILCYILIPIIVGLLIISAIHIIYLKDMQVTKEQTKYSQTEYFADNYLSFCLNKISQIQNLEQIGQYIELKDKNGKPFYYTNGVQYNNYHNDISEYINYIIIDRETQTMYTNIKSSNYQETIDDMQNNNIYWKYVDDKVETNIEQINQENIKYNYNYYYSHFYQNETTYNTENYNQEKDITRIKELQDYDIYTFYDEEKAAQQIGTMTNIYEFMMQNKELPVYVCIIGTILLVIIAIYLFWSIGHKKGKEITLGVIEKIPYEFIGVISLVIIVQSLEMINHSLSDYYYPLIIIMCIIFYAIGYTACCIFGVTTIKRIKANKFWESFLIYKIIKWISKNTKKFLKEINSKIKSSRKAFWYYCGFILINIAIVSISIFRIKNLIFILIIFWIWVYYRIKKYLRQQNEIKEALEKIYEGKTNIYLNQDELFGTLKEMAIYINDISSGFANSIETSLKSERLKAELITNVSHDIKTPLTSIINYVDLLKKENIQDEKIKQYIEIIDAKSQRLKKLTEDVIDASKASSGNLKLNIEEIDIKELINQSIGEFKDKFEKKNLRIETNIQNEDVKIKADSRYMYRIVENLFSNITKYALENSRVYIDVKNKNGHIEISIKNISKEKLNISSDELMQRFVRGDKARYTEGSGLRLIYS